MMVTVPLGHAHVPADQIRQDISIRETGVIAKEIVEEAIQWLPRTAPQESGEPTRSGTRLPSRPDQKPRSRILLADDNADMRDYISRLLGERHDCVTAADGQQALDAVRARRPDLLLTDIMMPRLDGFALIRAVRTDPELRDLPIIVISARAGEESSVEGLIAGADDYLVKPFTARELIARVDGALAMARVRREMGDALREEARSLELLNQVGAAVAAELDLDRAVQVVTDAATELTGAAYGSFFYNVIDGQGGSYTLFALSGAPRESVSGLPMPRKTDLFAPTFAGNGIVRVDDVRAHPDYGKNAPHLGMPKGHLPVCSYLTSPVVSRSGEVLGALFFGHPKPGVFTARSERLLAGIAAQAAIAIDNARLFKDAQNEITERTRTELALRESEERQVKLNQSLESIVADRTRELECANQELRTEAAARAKIEQALRQSQKMEAVGRLTGGIAHDFNNLLQVIGGNLQLLAKEVAGTDRAEQRVRNALAGVSRGSKLASQLLSFGRRQPLAPKVVNLGRFLRGLDDLLSRALGDGVEIDTVVPADLWNTLVDTSQVENALLNLAINARDAMNGHGKLTIEASNEQITQDYASRQEDVRAGNYVMLAVSDTGCGMTPEVMEQVFEPFFTTKPEGRGTGLGLSMVYGFVKQSGGHIVIYSELDEGTTIRVYLPRALGPEDVVIEADTGPVTGGTESVLVVEDDEEVRATVVELLSDLGYRVVKALDAESALVVVESGVAIDLLFTDVVMPGLLRSPELARLARVRLPDIAVLFTSGYTEDAIVHGGRLDPGTELLSKPYTREALARKIRHVLRNQKQRSVAAARKRGPSAGAIGVRSLKILFVEDDELIRLATVDMLTGLGHVVFQAEDATAALGILAERSVDVLMTDLGLPGMSGGRLAVEARRRDPLLKVIFATGAEEKADDDNAGNIIKENFITLHKPYDVMALDAALRSITERRRGLK